MKSNPWLVVLFLALICASRLQAGQESATVETKVKTVMIDPTSQSPVVVLDR